MIKCAACGERYYPRTEQPCDHGPECPIREVLEIPDPHTPLQIRTDAPDLSDSDKTLGPAHVYLSYGLYPDQALCGHQLYGPKGEGEGNPPMEDGDSMRATLVKADYDSLGAFLDSVVVCHDCEDLLAQRLRYPDAGLMYAEHGAEWRRTDD